jgi:hypothetical protein
MSEMFELLKEGLEGILRMIKKGKLKMIVEDPDTKIQVDVHVPHY